MELKKLKHKNGCSLIQYPSGMYGVEYTDASIGVGMKYTDNKKSAENFFHKVSSDKYGKITYQGFPIKNTFKSKSGRKYVVAQRKNDYCVGNCYDTSTGRWAQGYYDFPTRYDAIKFAKKNAYTKK